MSKVWKQATETSRTTRCYQAVCHCPVLGATHLLKYVWYSMWCSGFFLQRWESGRMMLGLCTQEFYRRLRSLVLCANQQCLWKEGSHHVMTTWANFLLDWFEDNPSWNHPNAYDIATSESPMGREFQDLHFYELPRVV